MTLGTSLAVGVTVECVLAKTLFVSLNRLPTVVVSREYGMVAPIRDPLSGLLIRLKPAVVTSKNSVSPTLLLELASPKYVRFSNVSGDPSATAVCVAVEL